VVPHPRHIPGFATTLVRRLPRAAAALALVIGLLAASSGCGFNVQTNLPYTPAQGVNYNVGNPPVQVRNLMVLSREDGTGFLSATLTASDRDALVSVSGKPIKNDYTPGAPFTVTLPNPIGLTNGQLVILTQRPLITLNSADLQVGSEAELTLVFSTAGSLTVRVPIVNADEQPYATIRPTPSPSPSA
jgi:hypothetical protein